MNRTSRQTSRGNTHGTAAAHTLDQAGSQTATGLAAAIAVAVVVFFYTFHPIIDPDTWFHLGVGRFIRETSSLPRIDPFSFTAGNTPHVPSGWLTAVSMSWLDSFYPESGLWLILMVTLAIALASGLVLWRGWRTGAVASVALILMAGLTLAVSRFTPRPDVWTIPAFTALLYLLTRSWARPAPERDAGESDVRRPADGCPSAKTLWLIPPLVVLWANLHAGVLVALPFLLTYAAWLGWRWFQTRHKCWIMAMLPVASACVAWLLNPYGFGVARLAMMITEIPDVGWVMEWMPFFRSGFPMTWTAYVALAVLAGMAGWMLWRDWRRFHLLEILWLVMLFALMLLQRRQVGLAGLGVSLLLARHAAALLPSWNLNWKYWREVILVGAAVLLAGIQVSGANGNGGQWPRYGRNCAVLPCFAADFLSLNTPPTPIFNSYNFGGYLLNILYPEVKIYIDGRLDTYPAAVWQDMLALEENRLSIDDFRAKYGVKTFVVSARDSFGDPEHLAARLAARPEYGLVYVDDLAAVFIHREESTREYDRQHGYGALAPWDLKRMTLIMADPQGQQQAVNEMGRLLQQAPASAAVHALAAYIAFAAGDAQMSNQQLAQAQAIQPDNGLLRLVQNQLATAQSRLGRR